jgi:putative secretion ATPase (PEP-CTERM system associated)
MYESYYGFSERPFQLTPSAGCFYAGRLHKKALAYLQYGLSQGEGFIVITGDVGTGKTTIANQLLAQLSPDEIIARQIVTSKLAPDDLIRMIASSFNLVVNEHSKAAYLDAIYIYLKRLHTQHRRALLLVDEAQNLPLESIEELRMLSNFQINGSPLLQSFLLGQNELNAIIQAPNMEQFRQRIIASSNLTPLQEDETREYVEFRLRVAGITEPLVSPESYPAIHRFSRGVPRKINLLMDRVLLLGFLEQESFLNLEHIQRVIDEIQGEITHQQSEQGVSFQNQKPAAPPVSVRTQQPEPVQQLLNESLELKIRMLKELDELILKRQKEQGD